MPRVKKLEAIKEIIASAYKCGGTIEGLAATHGVSPGTIREILRRQGVTFRTPGRRKK